MYQLNTGYQQYLKTSCSFKINHVLEINNSNALEDKWIRVVTWDPVRMTGLPRFSSMKESAEAV